MATASFPSDELSDSLIIMRAKATNCYKQGILFKKGAFVEVFCEMVGEFFKCRIEEVNWKKMEVSVHFMNYNKRYDEVLPMDSSRIRPWPYTPSKDWPAQLAQPNSLQDEHGVLQSLNVAASTPLNKSNGGLAEKESQTLDKSTSSVGESGECEELHGESFAGSVAGAVAGQERGRCEGAPVVCFFCQGLVVLHVIVCGSCKQSFHARPACVGISGSAIQCLVDDDVGALQFVCCSCRIGRNSKLQTTNLSSDHCEIFSQLNLIIMELASQVRKIEESLKQGSSSSAASSSLVTRDDVIQIIRENRLQVKDSRPVDAGEVRMEVRELQEQSKRKESIIVRGMRGSSLAQVNSSFSDLCNYLGLSNIVLNNLTQIGDTGLFRAKIPDPDQRNTLLSSVNRLKDSEEFKHVFIHRDLTYNQRQELRSRRAARQSGDAGGVGIPSSQEAAHVLSSGVGDGPVNGNHDQATNHPGSNFNDFPPLGASSVRAGAAANLGGGRGRMIWRGRGGRSSPSLNMLGSPPGGLT